MHLVLGDLEERLLSLIRRAAHPAIGERRTERWSERRNDGARELVLHGEDVARSALVHAVPQHSAVGRAEEPGRHAEPAAGAAHRPVDDRADLELLADLLW